jgi:copper oxidase (laccase) domain-containing protein
MKTSTCDLYAWLGPAISQESFEVGPDVYNLFRDKQFNVAMHSKAIAADRWLLDLYGLAKDNLQQCGVSAIYGGNHCTYKERDLFFSYRRDNRSGRMASFIYIDHHDNNKCDS